MKKRIRYIFDVPCIVIMDDKAEYKFEIEDNCSVCHVKEEHIEEILKLKVGKISDMKLGFYLW